MAAGGTARPRGGRSTWRPYSEEHTAPERWWAATRWTLLNPLHRHLVTLEGARFTIGEALMLLAILAGVGVAVATTWPTAIVLDDPSQLAGADPGAASGVGSAAGSAAGAPAAQQQQQPASNSGSYDSSGDESSRVLRGTRRFEIEDGYWEGDVDELSEAADTAADAYSYEGVAYEASQSSASQSSAALPLSTAPHGRWLTAVISGGKCYGVCGQGPSPGRGPCGDNLKRRCCKRGGGFVNIAVHGKVCACADSVCGIVKETKTVVTVDPVTNATSTKTVTVTVMPPSAPAGSGGVPVEQMYLAAQPGSGEVADIFVGAAFACVSHNSVWTFLLGLPFERALFWHKLLGSLGIVLGALHGLWAVLGSGWAFERDFWLTGFIFEACMVLLGLLALEPVRRAFWELFYRSHVLLFCACIVLGVLHGTTYTLIGAGAWGADVLFRYFYMAAYRNTSQARAVAIPGGVVRIWWPKGNWRYRSGQYVFIMIPQLSVFEWHPFSLSSSPADDNVVIHLRVLGDWTRALHKMCWEAEGEAGRGRRGVPITLFWEGAYGRLEVDLDGPKYEHVLLVSGGIGITPMQSITNDLLHQYDLGRPLRKVWFVWACKDKHTLEAIFPYSHAWAERNAKRLPLSFSPDMLRRHASSIGSRGGSPRHRASSYNSDGAGSWAAASPKGTGTGAGTGAAAAAAAPSGGGIAMVPIQAAPTEQASGGAVRPADVPVAIEPEPESESEATSAAAAAAAAAAPAGEAAAAPAGEAAAASASDAPGSKASGEAAAASSVEPGPTASAAAATEDTDGSSTADAAASTSASGTPGLEPVTAREGGGEGEVSGDAASGGSEGVAADATAANSHGKAALTTDGGAARGAVAEESGTASVPVPASVPGTTPTVAAPTGAAAATTASGDAPYPPVTAAYPPVDAASAYPPVVGAYPPVAGAYPPVVGAYPPVAAAGGPAPHAGAGAGAAEGKDDDDGSDGSDGNDASDILHTEFFLTRVAESAALDNARIDPHTMSCLRFGRPDLATIFRIMHRIATRDRGPGARVAVLSCGPTPLVECCEVLSRDHGFDFHTETFDF